jgi:SNF2 family DNA or RNA helicase
MAGHRKLPEAFITIVGDSIQVKTFPQHYDRVRSVEGALWKPAIKAWHFPARADVAEKLVEAFNGIHRIVSPDFDKLVYTTPVLPTAILPPIPLFNLEPWEHQKQAFWFARGREFAMLDMDMGTGKSRVVVDVIVNDRISPVLIVCPKSVCDAWERQFRTHAARPVGVFIPKNGTATDKATAIRKYLAKSDGVKVVVVNYETAIQGKRTTTGTMSHTLLNQKWSLVVLDESHRIKAPGGVTSKFFATLAMRAKRRMCLTGTPMPHSPLDVYAQFRFLSTDVFGSSYAAFKARYAIMGGFQDRKFLRRINEDEFDGKLARHCFRVTADVLKLIPVRDEYRRFELSPLAQRVYDGIQDELAAEVGNGTVTVTNALTKLLKLQQLTSGYIGDDEGVINEVDTGKRELLADILGDLPQDEPVVVFCRFHKDIDAVGAVAQAMGRPWSELSGRSNELLEWQRGETTIIVVQIQSGGTGIDLTRARYCFYYSLGFSLGDYEQSRKRLDRPGQTEQVIYYHLLAEGTIDEVVYTALRRRAKVVDSVLEGIARAASLITQDGSTSKSQG